MDKRVLILALGNRPSGPTTWKNGLVRSLSRQGVWVRELDTGSVASLALILTLRRYQVVHGYHISLSTIVYLLVAKLLRKRIIFTVHGDVDAEAKSKRGFKKLGWLPLYALVFRLADAVTFPSQFLFAKVCSPRPRLRAKSVVIYNGIDLPDRPSRAQPRGRPARLLTVTNFNHYEKARGIIPLAEAVHGLRAHHPGLSLTIVGGGRHLASLRAQLQSAAVTFAGWQADVHRYLADCDLYVHSTFLDNAPYAILEAVAQQIPVIAVDVGGIRELLSADSIVAPTSTAIAQALERLLADPLARERSVRRDSARLQTFRWDHVITHFLALYGTPGDIGSAGSARR